MGVRRILTIGAAAAFCTVSPASAATLHGPLRYGKSGGIAGLIQRVTIKPDGSGFVKDDSRRRDFQLSENRLGALEKAVKLADIRHTRSPKTHGMVYDGIGLFVSYYGHTVRWGDGTDSPPKAVSKLAELLDQIFVKYRPSS
jgi:hypothetical protein